MNPADDLTARIQQIAERAQQRNREQPAECALKPPPMALERLPDWPEGVGGTPDSFLRGALFPAIQGKTRRYCKRNVCQRRRGWKIPIWTPFSYT